MNFGAAPLAGPHSSKIELVSTINPVPAAIAAAAGIVPSFPGWEYPFGNGLVYIYNANGVWTPPAFINGKPITHARVRVLGPGGGGGGGFVSPGVYHPGSAGGTSSFSNLLTATGGGGASGTTGAGGIGGIGSATAAFALLAGGGNGGAAVSPTGGASFTGLYNANNNTINITGTVTGSISAGQSISGPGIPNGAYVFGSPSGGFVVISVPSAIGGFYSGTYTCLGVLGSNAGSGAGGAAGSQLGNGGPGGFSTTGCGSGGGGAPGQNNGWSPATTGGGGGASAISSPTAEKIGAADIFGVTQAAGASGAAMPTGTLFRFPTETFPSGGGGGGGSTSTAPGNGGPFGGGGGGCFYGASTGGLVGGNGGWGAGGGGGGAGAAAVGGAGGLGGGGGGANSVGSNIPAAGGGGGGFAMATIPVTTVNYQITVGAAGSGFSGVGGNGGPGIVIIEI